MRLTPVDILANWYNDETLPWSAQKAVNCLAETAEVNGTRSISKTKGLPGRTLLADLGTGAPIRGAEDVEGTLFVVSGTSLFQIHNDFSFTNRGNIPGVGLVSMAHNKQGGTLAANELVIANGLSGYVYNTDTTALTQITDDAFPGATTFDYVDGYISFTDPEGRFWGHSALNQATQYSSIDRYDAESAPDSIVSHIVSHREVMVFGTRTTEFFRNTGAATGTFQRVDGTEMEVGIAAPLARARLDNTVYWLGSDGLVYRLAGHSPQRVSTRPVEQAISRFNLANAFAHTWEDRGHQVFYLTFPDGLTFGYDVATSLWHARETYGLERWGVNTTTYWSRLWVAGDYTSGKLHTLNWDDFTEDGRPMVMECQPGVTHADQNRVLCPYVELVMDTGQSPNPVDIAPLQISGDAPDETIGQPYSYAYSASGGFGLYTFTLASGSLPGGLTLSPTGVITGTGLVGGAFSFTVTVTDSLGDTASVPDTIEISFSPDLVVYGPANPIVRSGLSSAYSVAQTITPWGGGTPADWSTTEDGTYFLIGYSVAPRATLLKRTAGVYAALTSPLNVALTQNVGACAISRAGTYLAVSQGTETWVYKSNGNDTYNRIQVIANNGARLGMKFSPDGNYLVTSGNGSGHFFRVFSRSGDVFTQIFTGGVTDGIGLSWSADSGRIAFSPRLSNPELYSVVGSTVTLIASGTTAITGQGHCVLSPDGEHVFIRNNGAAPFFKIYSKVGATLVAQSAPSPTPSAASSAPFDMSADGRVMAIADGGVATGTLIYTRSGAVLTHVTTLGGSVGTTNMTRFVESGDYP